MTNDSQSGATNDTFRPAAQYIRMSTEHQRYSPDNQRAAIAAFAAERGYEVVRTYQDSGKSGLTLKKRPALQELLSDVLSGSPSFKTILVLDVSRWGRFQDTDQAAHYEYLCREAGVAIHYCLEPFDNDGGPLSAILKTMKRVMAAEYSRELSGRISRAQRHQAGLGFKQGGDTPLGLRRQVIDEHGKPRFVLQPGQRKAVSTDKITYTRGPAREVALVRKIFHLYVSDKLRLGQIEAWLNKKGRKQRNGNPWTTAAVRGVLTQQLYTGRYIFGKRANNLGHRAMLSPDRWVATDVMEPIVPKAIFDAAQERRAATIRKYMAKQEILEELARLLHEKGRLTKPLINQCIYLPNYQAIARHFGTLSEAYRLVGYESPSRMATSDEGHVYSDEDLLDELRRIHRERGYLSALAIRTDPKSPSKSCFIRRFGSLGRSFELAGFPMTWDDRQSAALAHREWTGVEARPYRRPIRRSASGFPFTDAELISHLKDLLSVHGHLSAKVIESDPKFPGRSFYLRRFGGLRKAYALAGYYGTQREICLAAAKRNKRAQENATDRSFLSR